MNSVFSFAVYIIYREKDLIFKHYKYFIEVARQKKKKKKKTRNIIYLFIVIPKREAKYRKIKSSDETIFNIILKIIKGRKKKIRLGRILGKIL